MVSLAQEVQSLPDRASRKMAPQIKGFATMRTLANKSDHLSLVPETHVMGGEIQVPKVVL